jgi:hypothetical protein
MKNIFFLFAFVLALTLSAQEKIHLDIIHQIKKEAISNSQIQKLSHELTDYIGPRLSGSTNLKNARKWSMSYFNQWQLTNVKEDTYGEFGNGWDIEKSYIAMTVPYYQTLIGVPKAWTKSTQGMVSGEIILVDIKEEADFAKYKGNLNGKIIILPSTNKVEPKFEAEAKRQSDEDLEKITQFPLSGRTSRYTPEELADMRKRQSVNQKIDAFLINEGVALKLSGTRGNFGSVFSSSVRSYKLNENETVPEMELTLEHHARMIRLLQSGKKVAVEAEIKANFLTQDKQGYNVLAEIKGTDKKLKDELVIIGAHLDSWHGGTGANDNASGVIVMMEVIRILKTLNIQPKRTIRIVLWGEEEQGLFGSLGYVKKYVKDKEGDKTHDEFNKISAYYNLDNGSGKIRGIYCQSNDMVKPIFEQWFAPFHELGAKTISNRNTGSTDHVAFDGVGIPGFQFIQDPIDYGKGYHTNMDLYERMMLDDMKQASIIIASLTYHTAMREEKLPRK